MCVLPCRCMPEQCGASLHRIYPWTRGFIPKVVQSVDESRSSTATYVSGYGQNLFQRTHVGEAGHFYFYFFFLPPFFFSPTLFGPTVSLFFVLASFQFWLSRVRPSCDLD